MTISSGIRRVAVIATTATALALGLGAFASAPALAQTVTSPTLVKTTSANSVKPAVYTQYWEFNYTGGYYNPNVTIISGVSAFALWGGAHFEQGNYVYVEFSNGLSSTLTMQTDGNLVLYHGGNCNYHAVWASNTVTRGLYATMQGDGNLVVYNGSASFASNTSGNPNAYLAIQSDGNLVIYKAGTITPIWTSNTPYC
jgi:hypothetical protein